MLTSIDLDAMRATLADSLPDTANIGRYTATADGGGGQTATWPVAPADTGLPCRLGPVSEFERRTEMEVSDKVTADIRWMVTFASDVSLTEKDRVAIGSHTFEVAAFFGLRSWNIGTRVLCRLVS